MAKTLVLFDFDGTITNRDTFLELIKYQQGRKKYYLGMIQLLPLLVFFKAGLIKSQYMKEKVMTFFWKDLNASEFKSCCDNFCEIILPKFIRIQAVNTLKKHLQDGHNVAVVSASAQDWVKPFCDGYSIKCIASKLEIKQEKITGKLYGNNCNAEEKVKRIKENFNLGEYDQIIAYGDSAGDKPMLSIASVANYKPFRQNQ